METKKLFPTYEVPELVSLVQEKEKKYRKSITWDFNKGDFVRDGANRLQESGGRDTYIQWCAKVAATERFMHLAYPQEIGTEMEEAMQQPSHQATESCIERTISEALLVNPKTEYVRDFTFEWSGDSVYVEFTVKGTEWEEISLNTTIGGEK